MLKAEILFPLIVLVKYACRKDIMRRVIVNGIVIFICFLLQTSFFGIFKLADVMPNVLIILISSVAMMRGQKEGMIVGFICGLLIDLVYSPYLGMFAFVYMIFGFVSGYFNRIYYENDILVPILVIGLTDMAYGFCMYIIYGLLQNHLHVWTYFGRIILPEVVYTAALGLLLYRILLRINRWLEKCEKGSVDFVS